jgi:hypothetical protein
MGVAVVEAKGEVLGIHILAPGELERANQLLAHGDDKDKFVTVPLTLADLAKPKDWQRFFDEAQSLKMRPIIRLTTRFENGSWTIPTRADVVRMTSFLSALEWHRPELTVVLFNEPNHANEWGGRLDPEGFADITMFATQWIKTEPKSYTVLPAAMDLAADGSGGTMEAFAYWTRVLTAEPTLLDRFDGWTSHSYPNPAFSASPDRTGKNSLRGYETELTFAKKYTQKDFPVYITETGWNQNLLTNQRLKDYFIKAYTKIWGSDSRIAAVTPFLLQGAPGTFAPFSFLDKDGKPTMAYEVYQSILSGKN